MLAMPIAVRKAEPDFFNRTTGAAHFSSGTRHAYLPTRPSPLSPRSANVPGRFDTYMSQAPSISDCHGVNEKRAEHTPVDAGENLVVSPVTSKAGEPIREHNVPFSARNVKPTPFSTGGQTANNEVRERRRRNFLRQVGQRRDEKRFELRGEDMMRLDYLQQRRQWETQLAREAATFGTDLDLFEAETEPGPPSSATHEETNHSVPASQMDTCFPGSNDDAPDEVDEYLQWEDAELQALLDFMPEQGRGSSLSNEQNIGTISASEPVGGRNPWSDDDEDDALFADYIQSRRSSWSGLDHDGDEAMEL